jgi:hypothetical protein
MSRIHSGAFVSSVPRETSAYKSSPSIHVLRFQFTKETRRQSVCYPFSNSHAVERKCTAPIFAGHKDVPVSCCLSEHIKYRVRNVIAHRTKADRDLREEGHRRGCTRLDRGQCTKCRGGGLERDYLAKVEWKEVVMSRTSLGHVGTVAAHSRQKECAAISIRLCGDAVKTDRLMKTIGFKKGANKKGYGDYLTSIDANSTL